MNKPAFRVHLVDDDRRVLAALSRVVRAAGLEVEAFADAESFLDRHDPAIPGCAIIDLSLPGKDGFDIQDALEACGRPVVFLTGQGNVPASVKAMRAGAVDFLEKPIDSNALLEAIGRAREVDETRRQARSDRTDFDGRLARLTRRERQVLDQVVAGRLNKQIAGDLGIVEKTIKVHRGRMMGKMGVRTVADLVRIVQQFQH